MAQDDNDLSVTLPEELRRQFADVQRRLWRVETTVAFCSIFAGLAVSLLALFISDRIWNTPPALRFIFSAAGLAAVVAAVWVWGRKWLWRTRTLKDLAKLVQKKYRVLGDRLLGIVELSAEQHHLANFSPELYHAAIRQVAEEARQYDFRKSVSARPAEKFAAAAAVTSVCWITLAVALPQASWNAFVRWLAPTSNIPRYTLVSLEGLPREMVVAHGEPFSISGHVQYRSFWKPTRVRGELSAQSKYEGLVDSGKINLQIPGQMDGVTVHVHVGDAMADVKVTPVYRPALRALTAQIQLPDYLQYPDQTRAVQSGSLVAVEGSRIAFDGTVSRPLVSAQMQSGDGAEQLKINGDHFSTPSSAPDGTTQYAINWRDKLGLSNAAPLLLSVAMQKDAPPVADLPGLPPETAMLDSDVLRIRAEASDDFGVRDLGLTWDLTSDTPLTQSITSEVKIMAPNARDKKLEKVFLWSPREFRIPPDSTVELQGYARDYYPERERSRTAPYRIRVLSPEEHAELVRQELEDVMAQIEDVTRLQEKIAANLRDVKDSEKLPESQKSARIAESKNDQLQNSSHLDDLSQQAQSALQEAMKNPAFPADNIRQWSQSAQQWQKLAQKDMKDAASAMQAAQQSPPSSQQQQMSDATQKAQDILDALQKLQSKAGQHMDDLQALTLSQRLRKVGADEKNIGSQLIKTAQDTIGLPADELPEKLKHFEHELISDQNRAQKESDSLQGEISRFYERTQRTNYGAVSKEMKDSHTTDELERLASLIGDNIGIQASGGLGQWSARLKAWGDELEPKEDSSGGSGQGSGGKNQNKDLTEQLIALLRMRESEMTLRDQTSVLDQQKGDPAGYKDRANSLVDTQKKLGDGLAQIKKQIGLPALDGAFSDISSAMAQVEAILKMPQTGPPADNAEGKTIDSMSDLINLINEQAKRSSKQQSPGQEGKSAEEMAFLLRMMQNADNAKQTALQPATGLNRNGGSTSRSSQRVTGNAVGKGAGARNVDKTSGVNENTPVEFRDALDNYFHGIEQKQN